MDRSGIRKAWPNRRFEQAVNHCTLYVDVTRFRYIICGASGRVELCRWADQRT